MTSCGLSCGALASMEIRYSRIANRASPGTIRLAERELTLLVTGRCRRCAERLPGGVALRACACPACGAPSARTIEERALVEGLFDARSARRTWIVALLAAAAMLLAGWAPVVAALVQVASFLWITIALVKPATRLLSTRRRLVAIWTFRLLGAGYVAINVAVVELLTLLPVVGLLGKTVAALLQVMLLAWTARRYLGWQVRRESRDVPVSAAEYVVIAVAALGIVASVAAALSAALWVTSNLRQALGFVDAAARVAPLPPTALPWSSIAGLGAATGTRAALFLLMTAAVTLIHPAVIPPQFQFLGSAMGVGVVAALVAVEWMTERDDDLQSLLGLASGGAKVAAAATLGVIACGAPSATWQSLLPGAVGGGVALAAASSRHWLHGLLRNLETEAFDPRRWLNRIEEGGVAGLTVAIYAGPMIAVAITVAGFAATLVAGVAVRSAEGRWRRPCPGCAVSIRVEACACPKCGADVPVARTPSAAALGYAASAWTQASEQTRVVVTRGARVNLQ